MITLLQTAEFALKGAFFGLKDILISHLTELFFAVIAASQHLQEETLRTQ